MISYYRNISPIINFGFGSKEITASIGQSVTVWLDTLYKSGLEYALLIDPENFTKISDYEYQVHYDTAGTYYLSLTVSNPEKTFTLTSNIITLTVE